MAGFLGCYYNVGRAQMQGVEVSAEAVLSPGVLRARASYTYTDARDLGFISEVRRSRRRFATLSHTAQQGVAVADL